MNLALKNGDLCQIPNKLNEYVENIFEIAKGNNFLSEESSINLSTNSPYLKEVVECIGKFKGKKYDYIVVIGIGGSNLGTKAIYDAIFGHFDLIEPERFPKIIFLDTTNGNYIHKLISLLKFNKNVFVNLVTKSGSTTESIVNFEVLMAKCPSIRNDLVVTTSKDNNLWESCQSKNIDLLSIPSKDGGRYSVFSGVGLLPLSLAGISVKELLGGAREALKKSIDPSATNPAVQSALYIYRNYTAGKNIYNHFYFNPELESLGKWQIQLLAESLGKEGKGFTPTISIGTTDLHSVMQLYVGGAKDKFFTLVSTKNTKNDITIETPFTIDKSFTGQLEGKTIDEVTKIILEGVKQTFVKKLLPFNEIILNEISERSLGEYMQFKMLETMYLGNLMNVNAFDQPDVEGYKSETRHLLEG
ncbi:hypothetical protein GW755_01340 [bacterium]|nr:hypothetical protein [bacterium]